MESLYLDVSAVRIQSYLARTPRLKGRRGASAAIAEATRLTDGHPVLGGRAGINTEAGEADGVVNLVLEHGDEGVARALARDVFAHLRKALPGAEFQAVWGTGATYLDAYHGTIGPRLARGDVLTDLPPAHEFPYAVVCRVCHQDPAAVRLPAGVAADDARDACADCEMRYSRKVRVAGEGAENELARALGIPRTADDLADLAGLGAPDTDRNHLGTVFIDGNAFGDFFHHLAQNGRTADAKLKTQISRDLNAHTGTALAEAARAVRRPDDGALLWAVPHLVGGDDVLVSVPADRAWQFTRSYLAAFGRLVEETRQRAGIPDLPRLSASAGLVFARATHPFHLVVEEAETRLRAAKARVRGAEASVDFVDITDEGRGGSDLPQPVTLATLEASAARLDALAALPASLRANLAKQLQDRTPEEQLRVRNTVDRLGHRDVVAYFWPDAATGAAPAIPLEQALRIVRWWR
jgi:hypothetical protein